MTAFLAIMLAAGATPLEAAIVANYAPAGVEVGKAGAATVSADRGPRGTRRAGAGPLACGGTTQRSL